MKFVLLFINFIALLFLSGGTVAQNKQIYRHPSLNIRFEQSMENILDSIVITE